VVKYLSVEIELSAIDNMSKVFKSIEKQMSVFEKTLQGLDRTLDDTSITTKESTTQYLKNQAASWAMNLGLNAAYQGVQMLGQGLRDGFDAAVNLEVAAIRMSHLIDDVTFKEITTDIKEFAKQSWFTTAQVTAAFQELATVGDFTYDEIQTLVDAGDDLALALGIDLDESVRLVAKTINAFNLEVSESGRVIDILTNAAAVSDLTVHGLIAAFGDVAGASKLLNIDLADITTAIGMIADEASVSGQEAGTFLNMFLTKIQKPSKAGAEAMKELGVSFFDAGGNLRNLGDIFAELAVARDRFNPEEYGKLIATAFEVRGAKAVLALTTAIDDNALAWENYNAAVKKAGIANEIAGEIGDTAAAKIRGFQGAVEAAAIEIAAAAITIVKPLADIGAAVVGGLTEEGTPIEESARRGASAARGAGLGYTGAAATTPVTGLQSTGVGDVRQNNTYIVIEGNVTDENLQEVVNATGRASGDKPTNDIGF
jgi:TP901 family phage tail tape measure protein